MPKTQINDLLQIWAASMLYTDSDTPAHPPFEDANAMLAAIDAIRVGDEPWQSFVCKRAEADVPEGAPQWMSDEYEVWFRDVDLTVQHLLANPDFADDIDFVPYREFDAKGERRYCDFFSGDWVWEQAVSTFTLYDQLVTHDALTIRRISSLRIQRTKGRCSCRLSSVMTKPLSQSQPVRTISIQFIYP